MSNPYTVLGSKRAHQGTFLSVREDEVRLENGHTFTYEMVEHPGGAAILPIDSQGICYLVKQYRHPVGRDVLEVPAGRLESTATQAQEDAVRECSEEVGFTPKTVTSLGRVLPSPGVVQEVIYLFLGEDLERREQDLDPFEILDIVKIPFDDLYQMLIDGLIDDAKTAMCILRAHHIRTSRS